MSVRKNSSRRGFLERAGGAAALLSSGALAPAGRADSGPVLPPGATGNRVAEAFALRVSDAVQDAALPVAVNVDNGDDARYPDKAGTFTKGLPHDSYGRVDLAAWAAFRNALATGLFSDFEKIPMGGTRTLNGPQGGLMFHLDMPDPVQFGQPEVPPAPPLASDQTAAELLEHYWGALLRDVAFGDYSSNPLVAMAAAEMGSLAAYRGPRNSRLQVNPDLLFRGIFPGETLGPYLSQFFVTPTAFGAQPLTQQMVSYLPGIDYITGFADWLTVQNGNYTGLENQIDPTLRYRRCGRDLAAFTHLDVLFQAYFTAFLVLAGIGAPLNPGNPYSQSHTENGFGTFGGPDIAATLGEVAAKALNTVWYQKWFVHLRPRPEAVGGLVHLIKSGNANKTDASLSNVILNSAGLRQTFNKYKTWLLPQAFPEGSPVHPAYPTGHGTVEWAARALQC